MICRGQCRASFGVNSFRIDDRVSGLDVVADESLYSSSADCIGLLWRRRRSIIILTTTAETTTA